MTSPALSMTRSPEPPSPSLSNSPTSPAPHDETNSAPVGSVYTFRQLGLILVGSEAVFFGAHFLMSRAFGATDAASIPLGMGATFAILAFIALRPLPRVISKKHGWGILILTTLAGAVMAFIHGLYALILAVLMFGGLAVALNVRLDLWNPVSLKEILGPHRELVEPGPPPQDDSDASFGNAIIRFAASWIAFILVALLVSMLKSFGWDKPADLVVEAIIGYVMASIVLSKLDSSYRSKRGDACYRAFSICILMSIDAAAMNLLLVWLMTLGLMLMVLAIAPPAPNGTILVENDLLPPHLRPRENPV